MVPSRPDLNLRIAGIALLVLVACSGVEPPTTSPDPVVHEPPDGVLDCLSDARVTAIYDHFGVIVAFPSPFDAVRVAMQGVVPFGDTLVEIDPEHVSVVRDGREITIYQVAEIPRGFYVDGASGCDE
jgi:hypothetical protein